MRLIDAKKAKEQIIKATESLVGHDRDCALMIALYLDNETDFPTVDIEPVTFGHWEDKYDDGDWHCSVCGAIVEKDEQNRHNWNRCYHCGARMSDTFSQSSGIDCTWYTEDK